MLICMKINAEMLNIDAPPDSFMNEIYFNTICMKYFFDKLYLGYVRKIRMPPCIILFLLSNVKQG